MHLALRRSLESFIYFQQKHVWVLLILWQEGGRDTPSPLVQSFCQQGLPT